MTNSRPISSQNLSSVPRFMYPRSEFRIHIHIKDYNIYYHLSKDIIAKDDLFMKYISENENFMNIFIKNFDYSKYVIILDLFRMT